MSAREGEDTLDAWILAENKIVTYRLLSRLLRVKGQVAKDIMTSWHKSRPTTHATYVLCGHETFKSRTSTQDAEPASNSSHLNPSSFLSHQSAAGTTHTVIKLVAEEDLEQVKASFDSILYCHIYSLEPARLSDIGLIASCKEDVKEAMKGQSNKIAFLADTFEIIFNQQVHELDCQGLTDKTREKSIKPIFRREESSIDKARGDNTTINADTASKSAVVSAPAPAAKDTKAPALKRGASNSLASAFAKTPKPKPRQPPVAPTATASIAPSLSRSTSLNAEVQSKSLLAASRLKPIESAKQQEANAALRDMMMDEDNSELNSQSQSASQPKEDAEMLDADAYVDAEADWSASDNEMQDTVAQTEADAAPAHSIRKRGRKKVKRQVHTKDAKGYMVTREEWEWISCDEDEVVAPAPVPALVKQSSSASSKSKLAIQPKKKTGGGGIANYFTKK